MACPCTAAAAETFSHTRSISRWPVNQPKDLRSMITDCLSPTNELVFQIISPYLLDLDAQPRGASCSRHPNPPSNQPLALSCRLSVHLHLTLFHQRLGHCCSRVLYLIAGRTKFTLIAEVLHILQKALQRLYVPSSRGRGTR